jgi:hypothetical protein
MIYRTTVIVQTEREIFNASTLLLCLVLVYGGGCLQRYDGN